MIQLARRLLARYSHANWALTDQTIISGVNFLTAILLARYLGLEEFGRFTLAWMFVLFINSLQHAMIISPMMSIGPKQSESDAPAYFGTTIIQQLLFSLLVFVLLLVGIESARTLLHGWELERLGFPLAVAAFFAQAQEFLRRYFFTRGRPGAAFAIDVVRYLGQIVILFWLLQNFPMDSAGALWAISICAAVATVFGILCVNKVTWDLDAIRTITKHHWHFAKWLIGSAVLQWTSGSFFILAAGALLGAAAVGALRAAQTLMGITNILFLGLENVVPVRAAWHFGNGGNKPLVKYLRRVALAGGVGVASISAIVAVAPEFTLNFVYGSEYSEYGYILRWMAVAYVISFMGLPLRAGLRAIEHTRSIYSAYQWTTLFTLVTAYPIIEILGISGAAIGYLMTQSILMAGLWIGLRKQLSKS